MSYSFSTIKSQLGISGLVKLSDVYSLVEGGPSSGLVKMSDFKNKNITYKFNTGGVVGSSGPTLTQMQGSRPWAIRTITNNQGMQIWQVPRTGRYRVIAAGARGNTRNSYVGSGAIVRGDFYWTAGQQIKIVVGQLGIDHNQWRPGGGASWVTNMANQPFIVAGGGGGGSGTIYTGHAQNGITSSPGGGCDNTQNAGGQNGQGGLGQGFYGGNTGGGGLSSAGGASATGAGGQAFINGASGGVGYAGCQGGFGGGGACIGNGGCPAGGGGGGGASGDNAASGGGGSYNIGANQSNLGLNTSEGYVNITQELGILDNVSTMCVAAYGMKHLNSSYTGPIVRYIRANDNSQLDFYADTAGNLSSIQGTTLASWVSGTSASLVTWYDQTGRGKHLNTVSATRPSIITGDSNAIYLSGGHS